MQAGRVNMSMSFENNGVLHILLSAEQRSWQDCLRSCKAADSVVLLDTAVMGLTRPDGGLLDGLPCPLFASDLDVDARIGTANRIHEKADRISDDDLIVLLEKYPRCLSWR